MSGFPPILRGRLTGSRLRGSRGRRRRGALRNRRLACEPLEQRTVLSVVLDGDVLDLGINDDGSLITAPSYVEGVGASFNGVEFLTWGSPWAVVGVSADGVTYTNAGPMRWGIPFPVTVTDTSSDGTLSALVEGTVTTGLELERTISFARDGSVVRFTVALTNTGSTSLENVAFTEGVDPDQGYLLGQAYYTYNDVVLDGDFVRAHALEDGSPSLTIGLGSADPRATVSVEFWAPDPFETINSPYDPEGSLQDGHLHLAFDFGTLAPGQSVAAEYAMVLAPTPEEAEQLYLSTGEAPPVAVDDSYAVDEDQVLSIAGPGVLLNDSHPRGAPLAAAIVTDPSNGTVKLNPDGSFTYTPDADFFGTDRFVYEVSDGGLGTDTATVTLTVSPVIDALIDVKPGSGAINLGSNGILPVVLLTTSTADGEPEDFDATSLAALDLDGFALGDARADHGRVSPLRAIVADVDGDGDLDLLLHFSIREIRETGVLDSDTVDVVLTAEFGGSATGVDLAGHDAVRMISPKVKDKRGK
jgi:hypothetical protein